jgi:RND family efflux transporter MFP subunit
MRCSVHVICAATALSGLSSAFGQLDDEVAGARQPTAAERQQVVIERMPLSLRDPHTFQAPLRLDPVKSVDVVAQLDGVVSTIPVKPGEKVSAQAEAVRMESTERRLQLERAQAAFRLAQLEQKAASGGQADLAQERLNLARLDLELAQHRLEQAVLRAPFDGHVMRIHVVPGQFVRAGQPLVTIADLTKLAVEVPVDRKAVKAGDSLQLKVEEATVGARVEAILPLNPRFEPLRDLFLSIASAQAVIDNPTGQYSAGQTVYSELIPRQPVTEVPTATLANMDEGGRKVQIIREGFVRDVPVVLLGQMGEGHVFVAGRFSPSDELVVKSSEELLDGTRVVQSTDTPAAPGATGARPRPGTRPGGTSKQPTF